MKFFLDTADLDEIREAASWGVIAGVTTNPSLYARIGGSLADFPAHIQKICALVKGPVSAEATSKDRDGMVSQGRELAQLATNIAVKVPTTVEGLAATKILSAEGIDVNMTLCFTVPQALLAARAGARYISPFVGRFDDISEDGIAALTDVVSALENYDFARPIEVIAASLRSAHHVTQAALIGADIATVPFPVLRQLVAHPLTDRGIEAFESDWQKVVDAS